MSTNVTLRQETPADYDRVFSIIEQAFKNEPHSDHQEQFLVQRLRSSDAFVPELSIVAELNGEVIGHILMTKIVIKGEQGEWDSLALAPVSVDPAHQGKGIGGQLIVRAHEEAARLGYGSSVLLGHAEYYPRFGYKRADSFGVKLPFEVPPEFCQAIELIEGSLDDVNGTVQYAKEFFE